MWLWSRTMKEDAKLVMLKLIICVILMLTSNTYYDDDGDEIGSESIFFTVHKVIMLGQFLDPVRSPL